MAEELVQEAFISLYKHKHSLKMDTSIKAYLYIILKNKITDHYRLEVLHQRYANYVANNTPANALSTSVYVETRELEQILKTAIDNLPPKCQEVFRLSREKYLSDKEIAVEMNISVKTVEQHKSKAHKLLKGALAGLFEMAMIAFFLAHIIKSAISLT